MVIRQILAVKPRANRGDSVTGKTTTLYQEKKAHPIVIMAPVVKALASLSSFMMRWMNGKIMGVMHELNPMRNHAANFIPRGMLQIRRQMLQKRRTVAANVKGIQMG